jgi:hypothetical protein
MIFESQQNLFFVFVIVFILYYITIIKFQKKALFFTLIIIAVLFALYQQRVDKEKKQMNNVSTFISNVEDSLIHDSEIPEDKVFPLHKVPKKLSFIKKFPDFQQLLYELRSLKTYDKSLYDKIVSYIEFFLRIHFKVMIGKYDHKLYYPILKDIRNELLNTTKTIVFNVPNDSSLEKNTEHLKNITYRYMKTLYHKYPLSHITYKAPFENDTNKNNHYHAF